MEINVWNEKIGLIIKMVIKWVKQFSFGSFTISQEIRQVLLETDVSIMCSFHFHILAFSSFILMCFMLFSDLKD